VNSDQVTGYRMQDTGYRMQDAGCRMQEAGYMFRDARAGYLRVKSKPARGAVF